MDIFAKVTEEEKERGYIEVAFKVSEKENRSFDTEIERILLPKGIEVVSRETILKLLKENNFEESQITDVHLPDSVVVVLDNCFENLPELWTFSTNRDTSNLQYIGNFAFAGCKKLYHADFPNSIRYIGTDAFNGAKVGDVNIMYLYSKVDFIAKDAFHIEEIMGKHIREGN